MDERLATTAAGIWALGEAAGSPMFTHVALGRLPDREVGHPPTIAGGLNLLFAKVPAATGLIDKRT
jgi:hypothetical protein